MESVRKGKAFCSYICVGFLCLFRARLENGEASGYAVRVVVKRGGVGFTILREKG